MFAISRFFLWGTDTVSRNHKPTESDLEDDDEDDEEEDPSSWFEDDQDDGRKGQDIIEPDMGDLTDIIRVDESRLCYNTLYEPGYI
jgi:hypothetical protein